MAYQCENPRISKQLHTCEPLPAWIYGRDGQRLSDRAGVLGELECLDRIRGLETRGSMFGETKSPCMPVPYWEIDDL